MKLYFTGHDCKYAVEQMMMTLFPGQRPLYPQEPPQPGEDWAAVEVARQGAGVTASARLCWQGREAAACRTEDLTGAEDPLEEERRVQHAVRFAFYEAGVALLGAPPAWGALTGVRPVKLPAAVLAAGGNQEEARALLTDTYGVSPARADLAMDCALASVATARSLKPRELSLYVGIPFCPTRCAYCSFISADVGRALKLVEPYLEGLFREIDGAGAMLRRCGWRVRTVYIGGGTPTTLTAGQLHALLGRMEEALDLSGCTEFTVEAGRPDTITAGKLSVLRAHGVDRVSVNPQTMEDHVLSAMGRSHTAGDILAAMDLVRESGIPLVNMDLIAGLPQDTLAGFCRSLDQVMAQAPANITVHTLALKRGARLMEGREGLPSAEEVAAMLDYAGKALRGAGYRPYYLYRQKYMSGSFENVGWCLPGTVNAYNICMMEELHPVLSLGAGGVTKLVGGQGRITRLSNPKYPQEYIQQLEQSLARQETAEAFLRDRR